jgi:hypothetical protein
MTPSKDFGSFTEKINAQYLFNVLSIRFGFFPLLLLCGICLSAAQLLVYVCHSMAGFCLQQSG